MLTSWHLNEKSRQVCIKARSLAFIGQVTKHITVKWPIRDSEMSQSFSALCFNIRSDVISNSACLSCYNAFYVIAKL